MAELKLEDWFPMEPQKGPPLPKFLNIYWPWYKTTGAVQLKAGWNEYRYEGAAISGKNLLASIKNYLIIAYYLQEKTNLWVLITDNLLVQPGYLLKINVSEDCTWTF